MEQIKTAALIGLGAIGAAYGERLQQHLGNQFSVLADKRRLARYAEHGIRINGRNARFNYQSSDENTEPVDLLLFGVKNDQLAGAIEESRPFIGPDTILLPLLNGISSEDELKAAYPENPVLYSMCVGIDAQRKDRDISYSKLGKIVFGTKDGEYPEAETAVRELFEQADVPFEIPDDIWREMWWKFMLNVGINQISSVLRAPYSVFQNVKSARDWLESVMMEVVRISRAVGVNLTEADIQRARPVLESLAPEGKTSMLQDIEHGRKTEVEYMAGKVIELGERYDVDVPENRNLLRVIRILEKM
ncbi:ketopantoate reductase family protein [Bhargavaea cecembensis]|uniref:ketopantoate reductase family protein n=1 Tax=Bhargavaea cecembensis TaxID=394098 RepID=UPI00058CDA03|nr:ketopantoate reductase family protein [Bhargavaea cecembensis]